MAMRRDRVAEDVYTFTSALYAQVNAGLILTSEGTIVIDTLPFPEETRELMAFVNERGCGPVHYVINTHYHSDHTNGTYLFPNAEVISHRSCRETLLKWGAKSLAEARRDTPALADVKLRLPDIVFDHDMYLHLGHRSLYLVHLPGHTNDSIGVFVEGAKILFAGDAVLPVPYIVWGDPEATIRSFGTVRALRPDSVVQGHGQLLLRGELAEEIESSTHYLRCINDRVRQVVEQDAPSSALYNIDIESCGKSRIPLDGLVRLLHEENLFALYQRFNSPDDSEWKRDARVV
jgi:cyclase